MANRDPRLEEFRRLLDIIEELRAKCPWDIKQTNESLRKLTIEETYELADAIIEGNESGIRDELGDLMLHIVFYAIIGKEKGTFTISDVLKGINDKLVYRHPHVFGKTKVNSIKDIILNWEKIKLKEKLEKQY